MMGIKCFIFIVNLMLDSVTLFKKNISNFLSIKIIQLLCYNFVYTFLILIFSCNTYVLFTKREVKMAGYWPSSSSSSRLGP